MGVQPEKKIVDIFHGAHVSKLLFFLHQKANFIIKQRVIRMSDSKGTSIKLPYHFKLHYSQCIVLIVMVRSPLFIFYCFTFSKTMNILLLKPEVYFTC